MGCLLNKTPVRALYRVPTYGGLIHVSVPSSSKHEAILAVLTGLEPAIFCVTGRRDNRYTTALYKRLRKGSRNPVCLPPQLFGYITLYPTV